MRPSLFEGVPRKDLDNIPLLLDRIYGRLGSDIDRLEVQVKGRLGDHENRLTHLSGRMDQQEDCPCQVHRDAAHDCPILAIKDQISKLQRRLAWYAGVFAAVSAVLYALSNIIWIFKHA